MARHDLKRRGSSKKAWALFSAALIASGGLITAQATTGDLDISGGALSFTSAKEKRGTAALSSLLTQPTDGSPGDDIGAEIVAGDYVDYYGLAVVGARTLDARVTFVSENGLINDDGLDGQLDKFDDYTGSGQTENTQIRMYTDFTETGAEDAFIELKIEFFEDLQTSPTSVVLDNVYLSIYDIDNLQFVEISDFDRYYLNATGSILTADPTSGILRIQSSDTPTSSRIGSDITFGRASFDFDSTSSITLKLGQAGSAGPGIATFDLDFGPGVTWATRGTDVVNTLAANKIVSFVVNGGSGFMGSQAASTATALRSNTLSRSGFNFSGWNTAADGSGTPYADGASFPFTSSTTLFAQWSGIIVSSAVPYQGPIGLSTPRSSLRVGAEASVTGSRLSSISKIYIDNIEVPFTAVSDSKITFTVPDMKAGKYQTKYRVPVNSVNLTDSITIGACSQAPVTSAPSEPEDTQVVDPTAPKRFYDAKRFSNYLGDRSGVISADERAITAFLGKYQGITRITCLGSTSVVPAAPSNMRLATNRANNACDIARKLNPEAKITIRAITGRGIGQFHRSVSIFVAGTN
jgi:hypothetical protein